MVGWCWYGIILPHLLRIFHNRAVVRSLCRSTGETSLLAGDLVMHHTPWGPTSIAFASGTGSATCQMKRPARLPRPSKPKTRCPCHAGATRGSWCQRQSGLMKRVASAGVAMVVPKRHRPERQVGGCGEFFLENLVIKRSLKLVVWVTLFATTGFTYGSNKHRGPHQPLAHDQHDIWQDMTCAWPAHHKQHDEQHEWRLSGWWFQTWLSFFHILGMSSPQ